MGCIRGDLEAAAENPATPPIIALALLEVPDDEDGKEPIILSNVLQRSRSMTSPRLKVQPGHSPLPMMLFDFVAFLAFCI